jgi:UTP-glucose-1-phosphate uridylyltransferase
MTPTLVLLAAGMSTRYGRLKQLEPVGPGGEALLDYSVFDARRAGVRRILLIIRRELREAFEAHTRSRWPADLDVVYHYQCLDDLPGLDPSLPWYGLVPKAVEIRTKPWGTAHALLSAESKLPGPFMVLNADDFYGESAFWAAANLVGAIAGPGGGAPSFGLVTYTLAETLSNHGGVNRGVCEVDAHGSLRKIREILDIRAQDQTLTGETVQGRKLDLTGKEPISTNFWVLTPDVFPLLRTAFREFMAEVAQEPGAQPEFLIPSVVNEFLNDGRGTVRCVSTSSRFLGITHPEDRQGVVDGLEEMTAAGDYPRPLWQGSRRPS